MRVLVGYPPVVSEKVVPLLSQNRQFQWFHRPTYIYPMVPASAATLAAADGHEVRWCDAIAERMDEKAFERLLREFAPDVFLTETKTPVVKATWLTLLRMREVSPRTKLVLAGDHVTALPDETMEHCPAVDFILRGGDFDVLFRDLLRALERRAELPAGVVFRKGGAVRSTGDFRLDTPLDSLPWIDRDLTKWELYSRENGNFRDIPGTYTMAGRDCWWGKCHFCSWTTLYPSWRTRSPENVLDEIGALLDRYPLREIFDDTGCFPAGDWLRRFCAGVVERGYHKRVTFGCNMIPGALSQELYDAMGAANFKFVLFGLESAQEATLRRINKCPCASKLEESLHMAKRAGLRPHVTCMVGYPWETKEEAQTTIDLARRLFDKGDIDTLQATVVIPYPGTPLFRECQANGWLKTEDWDRYDMREPVMKSPMADSEILAMTRGIYSSFLTPRFLWRQLTSIRTWRDVRFYARAAGRVAGHLLDFARSR
jgi:radical SAM superfamily enzyme YgiQ (UPF0313 family)